MTFYRREELRRQISEMEKSHDALFLGNPIALAKYKALQAELDRLVMGKKAYKEMLRFEKDLQTSRQLQSYEDSKKGILASLGLARAAKTHGSPWSVEKETNLRVARDGIKRCWATYRELRPLALKHNSENTIH